MRRRFKIRNKKSKRMFTRGAVRTRSINNQTRGNVPRRGGYRI